MNDELERHSSRHYNWSAAWQDRGAEILEELSMHGHIKASQHWSSKKVRRKKRVNAPSSKTRTVCVLPHKHFEVEKLGGGRGRGAGGGGGGMCMRKKEEGRNKDVTREGERGYQRDWEGKSGGHNCPWLLKGLRQSQPYPTYPQAAMLRHQRTHQRLDKGLPHGQTTGCSGGGNKIWPSARGIWRPTGVSPRTKPFSAVHQWPPWRHQVKDPPICRWHHVQQDHHEEKNEQVLQVDLHSLTTWEEKWSMEFHLQKCSTLRVSRKKDKIAPAYELHGQNIENVSTTKYLGVNIQDNMQWESHIDSISKKASKTLGFIRHNLKIGNKKTKETAYKALVRPLLEYAAPVWDPYTANEIEALEKIQRRAARWVTNRHRQTSCVDSILEQLDWPPLHQHRKKARLEMFYKFHHGLISINSKYLPKPSKSRLSSTNNNNQSYDIPTCTTQYRQMALFPRTIPEWNTLPQDVVTAKSLDCFKSRLAPHLQKAN